MRLIVDVRLSGIFDKDLIILGFYKNISLESDIASLSRSL